MARPIDLVGVPSEAGALNGTSAGPLALRDVLLTTCEREGRSANFFDLALTSGKTDRFWRPKRKRTGKVHFQKEVAATADLVAKETACRLGGRGIPVILGGDHSVAIGSGRAALEYASFLKKRIGLLWIDAHYDAHTHETSQSHNANGMPLATLLGYGARAFRPCRRSHGSRLSCVTCHRPALAYRPEHVLHLGAGHAYCEPEEKVLLERLGVRMFSQRELSRHGEQAWIALIALIDRVDMLWVSFDLDAVNKAYAPGVHLRADEGIDPKQLYFFADWVAQSKKLCGLDITEYKPSAEEYDVSGRGKTAMLAAEFLARITKEY